jgi:hypothetical protein
MIDCLTVLFFRDGITYQSQHMITCRTGKNTRLVQNIEVMSVNINRDKICA